ncbi:hypothetical protein [Ochrobactrum sp. AN78]|uniref:hypothetical protein n=1 Tax=Ochrobactrum sp. AN78 TaxID=3039853 RepID=UPI002989EDAB|nr:hypothetical protein [Ochrobactrum sp. AN78]MDH7792523.1 TPR repeat protein [Ochrobactrum sp. AN78]
MAHTIISQGIPNRLFIAAAIAIVFVLAPFLQGRAQDLPAYQTLDSRRLCTPTLISQTPGQAGSRTGRILLDAGSQVRLIDITFGPDLQPYFVVDYPTGKGLQRATGFVPVETASNFCGFSQRADKGQRFVAPPNTCHLIAAIAPSLASLNNQARALEAFRPSMAAYLQADGHYALSLGLLNIRASSNILARATRLPQNSHCATGREFIASLVKTGSEFSQAETAGYASDPERLAAAAALLQAYAAAQDANSLKKACDLGLSAACSLYAQAIYDAPDPAGDLPATVTHYALLGCMGGDVLGCKLAINRSENTLENAQFRAIEGGTGDAADLVTPELAKPGCDAGDAVSCVLLARGTASGTTPTAVEASSNFAASYTACRAGIAFVCRDLLDSFDPVIRARGQAASATPDENYALAAFLEESCVPGPAQDNRVHCKPAYYKYRDFLQAIEPNPRDTPRLIKAKALLERGCAQGDPSACIAQTRLAAHWALDARNESAARALALCKEQADKDSACTSVGSALDPTLAAAAPAQIDSYQALSNSCRTDASASGPQACAAAVSAALASKDIERSQLEAMLNSACSDETINGCQALASLLFDKTQPQSPPPIIANRNVRALVALEKGCRFDNAPASTCLPLAQLHGGAGDIVAAMDVFERGCAAHIAQSRSRPEAVSLCYEAAKFALQHKTNYPAALQWADFACKAADPGLSPYACKLIGNIYALGLGTAVNTQQAAMAYQTGCFHPFVTTTDGEACIKYGNLLLEAQPPIVLAGDAYDRDPASLITEAARAYDMGCMDDLEQACELNRTLLGDWSRGRYPHDRATCSVRDDAGTIRSEKTCRRFFFYQAAAERKISRRQLRLDVHVWPDGDKTVIYQDNGRWLLNEVITDGPRQKAGRTCWRNPISKRSFCAEPL